jgi:GcrA cell cycle regulator
VTFAATWTPAQTQQLREDWDAKDACGDPMFSASQIGERLGGFTRSAVLGMARRMDLARRGESAPKSGRPRKERAQTATVPKAAAPPPKPRAAPQQSNSPRHGQGCSLRHLTTATCRWPVGDPLGPGFVFCGNPGADNQNGRPYCAYHARVAYTRNGAAP